MNKAYRLIWSRAKDAWVVAAENVSGRLACPPVVCASLAAAAVLAVSSVALALPTGSQVVNGTVSMATQGSTLTVTNSPNSIINWQGFSIGAGEATRFIQQSSTSSVLNRVVGVNPSNILGSLQSNGRIFLVNPNGIIFGQGARVDAAGLVASTLNITNTDYLGGRYLFSASPSAGAVKNQGSITTPSGCHVWLIAPNVENSGIITAPNGSITLAAGQSVHLVDPDKPEVAVVVSAPADQAVNLGSVVAQGGRISMFGAIVGQKGNVNADSAVRGESGRIYFKSTQGTTLAAGSRTTADGPDGGSITIRSETGDTMVSGVVSAIGTAGTGGTIQILGNRVGLIDTASVDASGSTGGGTVLVGGDYQGSNPAIQNAQATYIGRDTTIKADAIDSGDGGKVIVWADDATRSYGTVSARGGSISGNGGFVETSGHAYLDFQGRVDTRAPHGTAGTLLLDPSDITIGASVDSFTGGFSAGVFFDSNIYSNPTTLTWGTINTQLGLGSLEIRTNSSGFYGSGDININAGTALTSSNSLTLLANNNINVAPGVSVSGSGPFNLIAGWNGTGQAVTTGTGIITFGTGSSLSTTGNVLLNAGLSVQAVGAAITANTLSIGDTSFKSLSSGVNMTGNNVVNTLSANLGGGLTFYDNIASMTIGTVAINGIVSANGFVSVRNNVGGMLVSPGASVTSPLSVSLQSAGSFSAGAGSLIQGSLTGVASSVNISTTSGGPIAIGGTVKGANVSLNAAGAYDISTPGSGLMQSDTIYLQSNSTGGIGTVAAPIFNTSPLIPVSGTTNFYIGSSSLGGTSGLNISHNGNANINPFYLTASAPFRFNATGSLTLPSTVPFASGNIVSLTAGGALTLPLSITSNELIIKSTATGTLTIPAISASGNVTLISGGTMSLLGNISSTNLTLQMPGSLTLQGPRSITSTGNQSFSIGGNLSLLAGNTGANNTAGISANGTQSFTIGGNLLLQAGSGGTNNSAGIMGYGDQSFTIGGSLSLIGGGTTGSFNNFAYIRHGDYGSATPVTGNQSITFSNNASLSLTGGSGNGLGGAYSPNCGTACSGYSSNNFAGIGNFGGSQTIDFKGGGAIALVGGSLGNGNDASIDNSTGTQQMIYSSTGNSPGISLIGGTSGGVNIAGTSASTNPLKDYTIGNGASLSSDGSQVIKAAAITLTAGTGASTMAPVSLGGATTTTIDTASLSMTAGNSVVSSATDPSGNAYHSSVFSSSAAIGNDTGSNVAINVGALGFTETGGSLGTYGSSRVLIGALTGAPTVSLTSAGGITLAGLSGTFGMGSIQGTSSTVTLSSGSGGSGVMDLGSASFGNVGGIVNLSAANGNIIQGTGGMIAAATLNANATSGISLIGANQAQTVNLTNTIKGTVDYTGTNISSISGQNAGGGGFTVASTGSIGLGSISNPGGAVSVTSTGGAITNASTSTNIKGSQATLSASTGIGTVATPVTTAVSTLSASDSTSGDIVIVNNTAAARGPLTLIALAGSPLGSIIFDNYGPLTTPASTKDVHSGVDVSINAHSPLTIGTGGVTATGGKVTLTAGSSGTPGAGDILTINGPVTAYGNILLSAGDGIVENAAISSSTGSITRKANLNSSTTPVVPPTTPVVPPTITTDTIILTDSAVVQGINIAVVPTDASDPTTLPKSQAEEDRDKEKLRLAKEAEEMKNKSGEDSRQYCN